MAVEPLDRNAHVIGRKLVLRRCLHGNADAAVAKQRKQRSAQHRGDHDDHHLFDVEDQLAQAPDLVFVGHGQHMRFSADAGNHGDQATGDVADANGQHHDGKRGLAQDGSNHRAFGQQAKRCHRRNGRQHRQPERPAQERHQRKAAKRTEHHQVALGETDGLSGLVDEHEAQRDEAVDAALRNTADDQLNQLQPISPSNDSPRKQSFCGRAC